jgi:hypothetical protein
MGRLKKRSTKVATWFCVQGPRKGQLNITLYGPKQAPKTWFEKIKSYLIGLGINQSTQHNNMYLLKEEIHTLLVIVYVDKLFITRITKTRVAWMKAKFQD